MAKAKKPSSRNKGKAQDAKATVSKPEVTGAADAKPAATTAGAKASQAAGAKVEGSVSAASKSLPEMKDITPKPDAKDAKAVPAAKDVKAADTAAKAVSSAKPVDAKGADAKTTAPAKAAAVAAAPVSAIKAAEAKTAASAGAKSTPAKDTAKVDSKTAKPADVKETSKAASKPAPVSKVEPAKEPEKSRGGFFPLVLGGVVAGGLGFAAAELNFLGMRGDTDDLKATLAEQQGALAEQQEAIAAIKPTDLSGIEGLVAGVSETASGLETRLTELENKPVPISEDGKITTEYVENLVAGYAQEQSASNATELAALATTIQDQTSQFADEKAAAYEAELAELRASIDEQKAQVEEQKVEIARLLENALSVEEATSNAAREATIQAAAAKLTAAMSSGEPFDAIMSDLTDAGISDLPAELTDTAADGVATQQALQNDFPETARAALSSARAAGVDAGTGGVGGFLKRQLGARSVAPREGDDPDAVLSRAEAAVRGGDMATALSELDKLPPEVQGAIEDWLAQARTRAAAEQAVNELSERLTAN